MRVWNVKVKVSRWRKWVKFFVVFPKELVEILKLKKGEPLYIHTNENSGIIVISRRKLERLHTTGQKETLQKEKKELLEALRIFDSILGQVPSALLEKIVKNRRHDVERLLTIIGKYLRKGE